MFIDIHTHKAIAADDTLRVLSLYRGFEQATHAGYCSLGVHPCYIDEHDNMLEQLQQYAALPNVLAIGECGLDHVCNKDAAVQNRVFQQQLELARLLNKPVIIHCVRAFDELVKTINKLRPSVPVIVHGYNKRPEVADKLLAAGMYLAFGAAILNGSWPATRVLAAIPANRFFLETDDANVSIQELYQRAAQVRKTGQETLILQLQQNFKDVFKREL